MVPKSASPEQQRIQSLEHALEVAMSLMLQVYDDLASGQFSTVPERWLATFLRNHGLDPSSKPAKALLKRGAEAYHFELEKAVKRAVAK